MKKVYSTFLLLLITAVSYSQTGTIRVARPMTDTRDTVPKPKQKRNVGYCITAGSNYTFKGIDQFGYEAAVLLPFVHRSYWGIRYSHENQYYNLSSYNSETGLTEPASKRSENKSDYIKIPLGYHYPMCVGNWRIFILNLGVEGEYLFNVKNQYGRLHYQDFRKYNLAGFLEVGFAFKRCSINIGYTKDLFNNLKNNSIYDETGSAVGKQKSKTDMLSLSLSSTISR